MSRSGTGRRHPPCSRARGLRSLGLLVLGAAASAAPAKQSDTVKISLLITVNSKPGWDLVIPNFERVYPNIEVEVKYLPANAPLYQLETTQLAAGNAPSCSRRALAAVPRSRSACSEAGYLAPMVNKPWATKRSLPLVTSYGKVGPTLFGFVPQVAPTASSRTTACSSGSGSRSRRRTRSSSTFARRRGPPERRP